MSASHRLWEASKRKWSKKAKRKLPRRRLLFSEGPFRAFCIETRNADLLYVLHLFAGGTAATFLLPVGFVADLEPGNLGQCVMSFLRKAEASRNGKAAGPVAPVSLSKHHPALAEFMFSEQYPDGTRRQRSTFTVMAGDATGLKVVLNDREEGRSLWATADGLEGCLESLELMLQSDDCPWRLDKQQFRSQKGGK